MLAETEDQAFTRDGWLFELKYDGARVLAVKARDGSVRLVARSGRDVPATYPEITRAVRHLPVSECAIDGEVVARGDDGRASVERLQTRFRGQPAPRAEIDTPVVYYAFDALSAQGHDLRALPLIVRKEILAGFAPRAGFVRFSDHLEREGEALLEAARASQLEGIVAKQADSRYESGKRSKNWLKIKLPRKALLAIVGFTRGKGSREALGSLLLAWRKDGKLTFAGAAGSGLDDASIKALRESLADRQVTRPEFEGVPDLKGLTFVKPELVAEVRYSEVTSAGMLRHPVFLGLRKDAVLADCEAPAEARGEPAYEATPAAGLAGRKDDGQPRLTRLDNEVWPVQC